MKWVLLIVIITGETTEKLTVANIRSLDDCLLQAEQLVRDRAAHGGVIRQVRTRCSRQSKA